MRLRVSAVAAVVGAVLGGELSGIAFAQDVLVQEGSVQNVFVQKKTREERREEANSRTVQGMVTMPDDSPANGAVVQLKDMRTLQVRSFITQADGMYHFSGLKADVDYQLSARSGDATAGPKTLSIFDTRKEAVMNFKLEKK